MIIAYAGKTVKQKRKDLLFYRHYGMILIETPAQKGENQNRRMKLMQYEIKQKSRRESEESQLPLEIKRL